jgi:hypothetical protein
MILELAGPAGVGKSSVQRDLVSRWSAAPRTIWGQPVPLLLATGVRFLPGFMPLWSSARAPLWDETRHLVRLLTLGAALRSAPAAQPVVFDEGPVFALAWLRGFGHPVMRSSAAESWWRLTTSVWAGLTDVVVVLDAPDAVLAHRIRSRPEDHEVKGYSDAHIAAWMARFRESLDWVLSQLTSQDGPAVIRINTAEDSPAAIAAAVLQSVQREAYAG